MTIATTFKMAADQQMPSVGKEMETTVSQSTPTHSLSSQLSSFDEETNLLTNNVNMPEEFGNTFIKFLNFDSMKEVGLEI